MREKLQQLFQLTQEDLVIYSTMRTLFSKIVSFNQNFAFFFYLFSNLYEFLSLCCLHPFNYLWSHFELKSFLIQFYYMLKCGHGRN